MRVSITTFAFLAYASLISAQCQQAKVDGIAKDGYQSLHSPNKTAPVTAGSNANITWSMESSPPEGNVALQLCTGPPNNCVPGRCIKESIENKKLLYTWEVPSDLAPSTDGGYGIIIINIPSGDYQYSQQFGVLAGSSPAPVSSASPASQITDGQVQVPTGSTKPTQSLPKYTPSGFVGTGPYYVPAPTGKVSNTTHSSGFKFSYGPNTAPPGAPINSTQFLSFTPGIYPAPTGVLPVTSVAIATAATPNGPLNPSVAPTATGVLTSPSNAAGKAVAGGLAAGLGAVAALVL